MKASDFLYLGLGAAFLAKDKIAEQLTEMEKRGDISKDEAKQFMDEAVARAKKERESFDARLREAVKDVVSELGLATKDDIEELKALMNKS
ncbi:phasin family protein [Desulfovibrio inopinatus]|uniref:phasin family protein n=1 Tax=Desulfovibrio inopinatus TaxID=102109 RepID=UPI0004007D48|nr:hypothetical protein [Desulfovibrio inopinatus]